MASDVSICSNALIKLGDQPITALTDDTVRARTCKALFADTRDAVLAAHPWNFAIEFATLVKLATPTSWKYANSFQLPTDPLCLRILDTDLEPDGDEWERAGSIIVTDAGSVKIRYIKQVTDSNAFSPLFVEALIARLSAELAYPITGNQNLTEGFMQLFNAKIEEARTFDGMEGLPPKFTQTVLIDARR